MKELTKKGQSFGLVGVVSSLVVVGILLIVGILVFSNVDNSIDQSGFTTDQNTTTENVRDTTLDAFSLVTVALIVLAAAAILTILIRAFRA